MGRSGKDVGQGSRHTSWKTYHRDPTDLELHLAILAALLLSTIVLEEKKKMRFRGSLEHSQPVDLKSCSAINLLDWV